MLRLDKVLLVKSKTDNSSSLKFKGCVITAVVSYSDYIRKYIALLYGNNIYNTQCMCYSPPFLLQSL